MKNLNNIVFGRLLHTVVCCGAALLLMALTACEGSELYRVNAPDWLSAKVDSIKNANNGGEEEEEVLEGQMEDVYNIGNENLTSGFWTLGKTYVVPAGEKWQAQFNLTVNPDNKYFKNFYIVLNACTNAETGDLGDEYGVIRYDNDPSKNSEWNTTGTEINRSLVDGNFFSVSGDDDVDANAQKMNGKITLTVDRSDGGLFIKMSNGTLTKTYTQTTSFPSTGADIPLACRIGVEGSLVSFLSTNIEPIGGCTSASDKQPLELEISGVPSEILVGTTQEEAFANIVGVVTFEEGVTMNVAAADLQFETIPNYEGLGQKTLIAIYNKTFKGLNAAKPVIATKTFSVVKELSAFTQTVVVPTPLVLGAEDNSSGWWSAHTDNIKVEPKETKVVNFTNYTSKGNNWNNFCIVLNKTDVAQEYAVVRADNYGWGAGYEGNANLKTIGGFASDEEWVAWREAMDGAKVTAYITNNGDGTADIKAVMVGNNGVTYTQEYLGINKINPDDMCFRFTVDNCHLVFDHALGTPDCTAGWWSAHTANVKVPAHTVCTVNFTNYSSGVNNWNNFVIVLNKANLAEYAVVRADNFGWGAGYEGNANLKTSGGQADWGAWLAAMNGAKCTAQIVNNGDGTADIKVVMHGTDGKDYIQDYIGINTIDPDDLYFRFTVDSSYLVFE